LQSSNVAWEYGVSGPFWYASGATIQVLLFGVLAIEIKRKAPAAHTICEIVRARWGFAAHMTFLLFCFMTNIIVTAMLLLGGSAVVNALTGMNLYAASFLIPLGVIVYTLAGGLKATFLASYIHSAVGTYLLRKLHASLHLLAHDGDDVCIMSAELLLHHLLMPAVVLQRFLQCMWCW
jgi:Na+/proline symporter